MTVPSPSSSPTTSASAGSAPLLRITDLRIGIRRRRGDDTVIVDGVSLEIAAGERFGVVGESGSGKSLTLRAIADLLPKGVEVLSGSIVYDGRELVGMPTSERRRLMGPEIAMIFQEPMTALNPVVRVGDQIAEGPARHLGLSKRAAHALALAMMAKTGIPDPARRARAYAHELSGGLRQRIMIAMAVSCSPRLVLCDEPTTALDVTVQHQVLRLLEDLCADTGTALAFVTHDLAVVNQTCTGMAVMYSGRIAESGPVVQVLGDPRHPYTRGLLDSAPDFDQPDRQLLPIAGFPPSVVGRPAGCAFAPRCPFVVDHCRTAVPPLEQIAPGHATACFESARIFEGVSA